MSGGQSVPTCADPRRRQSRGAFTIIELLVVIAIISVVLSIIVPSLARAKLSSKQVADAANVRSILQAMMIWSNSDKDSYPRPSELDRQDATVPTRLDSLEKDNTGNIFSLLVFTGHLTPQVLVSPAEINREIQVDSGYAYSSPSMATTPSSALWDPGFAGLPGEVGTNSYITGLPLAGARRTGLGNTSYAHAQPFGQRLRYWRNNGSSRDPIVSTRGPRYEGNSGNWSLAPDPEGYNSNRVRMFGGQTWAGNVGFNDGHVSFERRPDPESVALVIQRRDFAPPGTPENPSDNIFVNENDLSGVGRFDNVPTQGVNHLLQIFGDATTRGAYVEGVKEVYLRVFRD